MHGDGYVPLPDDTTVELTYCAYGVVVASCVALWRRYRPGQLPQDPTLATSSTLYPPQFVSQPSAASRRACMGHSENNQRAMRQCVRRATGDTVPLVDPSDVHLLVAACCCLGAYAANCVCYVDPERRTAENIHEHVNNITPQLSLPERIVA